MNCVICFKGVYLCNAVNLAKWLLGQWESFWLQYPKWPLGKILPVWYPVLKIHPCERQTRRRSARLTAFGRCALFLRFSVKDSEQRKRGRRGLLSRERAFSSPPPPSMCFFPFHRRRSNTGFRGDPTFHSAIILARRESSTLPPRRLMHSTHQLLPPLASQRLHLQSVQDSSIGLKQINPKMLCHYNKKNKGVSPA